MRVIRSKRFSRELDEIVWFIAQDSVNQAIQFEQAVFDATDELASAPRYRKSIHANDPNIRDFIFKGYTIPYLIDEERDQVVLLGICKQNLWYYEEE